MTVGKTYVLFIPPSWLIGGTVSQIENGIAYLKDVVYLESVASGHSTVGSFCKEANPKNLTKIITSFHPMPDEVEVRLDGVLMAVPAACSFATLARRDEAEAIRKAAR